MLQQSRAISACICLDYTAQPVIVLNVGHRVECTSQAGRQRCFNSRKVIIHAHRKLAIILAR